MLSLVDDAYVGRTLKGKLEAPVTAELMRLFESREKALASSKFPESRRDTMFIDLRFGFAVLSSVGARCYFGNHVEDKHFAPKGAVELNVQTQL